MANLQFTTEMFAGFQDHFNKDQDMKEEIQTVVRELEQRSREIQAVMQAIHQADGNEQLLQICHTARGMFPEICTQFANLARKIPADQYYRFHDHWRFVSQKLCFLVALIGYLDSDCLVSHYEAAQMLGVSARREDSFHVDLDDFLMALLQLASELSRLAVNAVTAGDYARPIHIAKFIAELDSGFRLLNLKNDSLRKRFDGLKYDLKKVEEVVYDISIRSLRPSGDAATT